jgi:hypothetical protein
MAPPHAILKVGWFGTFLLLFSFPLSRERNPSIQNQPRMAKRRCHP